MTDRAQVTGAGQWLHKAALFTQNVIENFGDAETPLFYFTHIAQTAMFIRKKELNDGAMLPAMRDGGHLFHLSILPDKPAWRERAGQMPAAIGSIALNILLRLPFSPGLSCK